MKAQTVKKYVPVLMLVLTGLLINALLASAQQVVHQTVLVPGGLPGVPVMSGIQQVTNGVQITWDGPSGYYQVQQKTNSLVAAPWMALGQATNLSHTATITTLYSNAFFRVATASPRYAGYQACIACHLNICSYQTNTPHASAYATLVGIHQQNNPTCLACHTVGYGLPTGFTNATDTPYLEGVQCENCHGPAADHAANPFYPPTVPRVDIAAQVCGGCHSGHTPNYEEWSSSGHSAVVPGALSSMSRSTGSISSCGRCHSGSARLALLAGQNPSVTETNDYDVPITCAVCHDPHALSTWTNELYGINGIITFTNTLTGRATVITNTALGPVYTNQLRCALASTEDFVLTTSAVFTNVYNPNINVCGQCHNDRGAAWTDTSRAPHHSPQYNMLLGTVGALLDGSTPDYPASHSRLEMQCVECHMQTTNSSTGHSFQVVTYQLCENCHSDPSGLVQFVTNSIASQIQQTKSYLDYWATNVVPNETTVVTNLTKYGTLAWEYENPGDLSSGPLPNKDDQALIPPEIMKARFDLYLVLYDGSYGVHNGPYDSKLLNAANTWVLGQITPYLTSNVLYVQSLF